MDTGGYGVGGFEIWRLWVAPHWFQSLKLSKLKADKVLQGWFFGPGFWSDF